MSATLAAPSRASERRVELALVDFAEARMPIEKRVDFAPRHLRAVRRPGMRSPRRWRRVVAGLVPRVREARSIARSKALVRETAAVVHNPEHCATVVGG